MPIYIGYGFSLTGTINDHHFACVIKKHVNDPESHDKITFA